MTQHHQALPEPVAASRPVAHFGHLDALRGIAILGVLVVHTAAVTLQESRWGLPLYAGSIGVQLFYMVSAFTLFLSLNERKRERKPLSNFFLRRFFRIAPLFYPVIVASWIRLQFPQVHGYRPTPDEWLLGFLFLFGFKANTLATIVVNGWSVAVETTFYAVLPFLHRYIRSLKTALLSAVIASCTIIPFSHFLARRYPQNGLYFGFAWFPAEFPVFLVGITIYFLWKDRSKFYQITLSRRRVISYGMIIASFIATVAKHGHAPIYTPSDLPVDIVIVACFFSAIIIYPRSVIVNPATRFLGKISFSIYLLHSFVYEALLLANAHWMRGQAKFIGLPFGHFSSFFVFGVVLTVITVALSFLSWRWIEQPGIQLGRRIIRWNEGSHGRFYQRPLPPPSSSMDTNDAQV